MTKYNKIKRAVAVFMLAVVALCGTISCEKFLDVESNHIVNEENKWKDINDIRGSLLGVYGLLRSALGEKNAHWMYGELRAGDFSVVNRRDLQNIVDGNLNSSFELVTELGDWRRFYAVINAANLFIERSHEVLEHDSQYTEAIHKVDIAQMRVMKGFVYYLLARTWGDVPLWDKAYEGTFMEVPKSSVEEILTYAENEILAAKDALPYVYGSVSDPVFPTERYLGYNFNTWNGVLFNKLAAYAMLAHINAWEGNYLETSYYADFVLANASKAAFVENDLETIVNTSTSGFYYGNRTTHLIAFPFPNASNEGSIEGHLEQLTLAAPLVAKPIPDIYVPVDRIVDIFDEPGDKRFHIAADGSIVTAYFSEFGGIRPLFSKIHMIRAGESGADGSLPLFSSTLVFSRYEEINLLKAEAYAVLGQVEVARAIVNQQRKNRGLSELEGSVDVVDAVFDERRKELMGEGWRWFDLVRYHKIKRGDAYFNRLIDDQGIYWPVSKNALSTNKQITQNPYWN